MYIQILSSETKILVEQDVSGCIRTRFSARKIVFERVDFLSENDFLVAVLVPGMSFSALARNLSSGSEPDSAAQRHQNLVMFNFDTVDEKILLLRYVLTT